MLQMLSLYLKSSDAQLNYSLLLKLIGKMPIEFFSNQAYNDVEAQKYALTLIQRIGYKVIVD